MRLEDLNISELGNYVILSQINPERLSKTFKVKHKYTEEIFVLKVVFESDSGDISNLEKIFKRLAKSVTKLNHPNIIKFKEYFISELDGKKCFVLLSEFFLGQELEGFLIKPNIKYDYDSLIASFLNICSAVRAAHRISYVDEFGVEVQGFPHGDITPWNIMINDKHEMKLLDFKVSNRFTLSEARKDYKKRPNVLPEEDNRVFSKKTDIFQLGYLLYSLFSIDQKYGTWKLEDKNEEEIASGLKMDLLGDKVNEVSSLIYNCTRKNPEERYENADALINAIKENQPQNEKTIVLKKRHFFMASSVLILLIAGFLFKDQWLASPPAPIEEDHRGLKPKVSGTEAGVATIGTYYALMMGNENYKHLTKLKKPAEDVSTFKEILTSVYGFEASNIITKLNATRDDMYDGFEQIARRLKPNDNLLIFYAGHGQVDDDEGYWIPIDGQENSRRDWISNLEIKHFLAAMKAKNVLIISDACFGGSILRDINSYKGGGRISRKRSRIALTSGSVETVPDKSVFIKELFEHLNDPQDTLVYASDIFSSIREGVFSNTNNDPGYGPIRDAGHQGGDFFFVKKGTSN